MSTWRIPVVKLHDNLLVPIQGALSDDLADRLKEDVGHSIRDTGATGLVIDVSGIDILDSYLTRCLHDVASVGAFMGARTVICGINAATAITLMDLGVTWGRIETALNLETALDQLAQPLEEDRESC